MVVTETVVGGAVVDTPAIVPAVVPVGDPVSER